MNDPIVSALFPVVGNSLSQEIENIKMAQEVWEQLEGKMYQSGVISKFNTLQSAMCICFTTPETVNAMIANMKDLIEIIYITNPPTKDEMAITLYLHAMMDGKFDWLWKLMIGNMTLPTTRLSPNEIMLHLEVEAQEAHIWKSIKDNENLYEVPKLPALGP